MTAWTPSGRTLIRWSILGLGLAWSAGSSVIAGADNALAPATRPVEVTAPGWVKVPLDPDTRARLAPDGRDLRVRGPSGDELAYAITRADETPAALDVAVVAIEETPGGWWIVMDTGQAPAKHEGIAFEFANRAVAPGVRLEASADRADWQPLASGDLFRVGESAQLQQSTLRYPATDARYLRLRWPEAAGYPEVRWIAARPAPAEPPPAETVALSPVETSRTPGSAAYDLPLAGSGLPLQRIELDWRGSGTADYRLLVPDDGRWRVLAEGALVQPAAGQPPAAIPLDGSPVGSPLLHLELAGGGTSDIALQTATGIVPRQWVVFYAPAAGRFSLDYGDLGMAPADTLASAPPLPLAKIPEVQPGPASARPWPDLPAAGAALGAAMPTATFAAAWEMAVDAAPAGASGGTAGGAAVPVADVPPGSVARLDLPPELYAIAQPDLADLRLAFEPASGGETRQVPFIRWTSPIPLLVLDQPKLVPAADPKTRTSRVAIDLPGSPLPYTELELTTPARPFDRRIEVTRVDDARPGVDPIRHSVVRAADWHCAGAAALPCRLVLDVDAGSLGVTPSRNSFGGADAAVGAGGSAPRLEITIHDGDDAPLAGIGVRMWRRSDQLVFVWPGEGAVRLAAGAPQLSAPDYDIQALEAELLARPALVTRLAPRAADDEAGGRIPGLTGTQTRWLMLGALALAAVVLLILLWRMVRPARRADSGGPADPGGSADVGHGEAS